MCRLWIDGLIFDLQRRGGITRIYQELLPRLLRSQPDLTVRVAVRSRGAVDRLHRMGMPVTKMPRMPPFRPWRLRHRVAPFWDAWGTDLFWRGRRADVFHSTYYSAPPVRCPTFCFVWDMIHELHSEFFSPHEVRTVCTAKDLCVRKARLVLCLSESTRQDVLRWFRLPEERCRVVYPGCFPGDEDSRAVEEESGAPSEPFALCVGNPQVPYKNLRFVRDAFCSVRVKPLAKLKLRVVAPNTIPDPLRKEWQSALGNRAILIEDCDDRVLQHLYRTCAVLLYPSLYEGFGLPVVEALACGAAVVCARIPPLMEAGGPAAYYFDPRSMEEFSSALTQALTDGRAPALVARRRQHAARFSWDKMASEFVTACRAARNY